MNILPRSEPLTRRKARRFTRYRPHQWIETLAHHDDRRLHDHDLGRGAKKSNTSPHQDRPLSGDTMNTGTRRADKVMRIAPDLHTFLTALAGTGLSGAPRPPAAGRNRPSSNIEGDVALPPSPAGHSRTRP